MNIGLKLDLNFTENQYYQLLFGSKEILSYIKKLGVQAVEAPIKPDSRYDLIMDFAKKCAKAGLKVSLHPYSEKTPYNPSHFSLSKNNLCYQFHEQILTTVNEIANLQNTKTIINIHAAADYKSKTRKALFEQSVLFFNWIRQWCQDHSDMVIPVAELQITPYQHERLYRIGDSFSELLALHETCGIKLCWDFGHAFLNNQDHKTKLDPPPKLLKHIIHVHCHDVNNDMDHQPLIYDNVPWRNFLLQLINHDFDGTIILEVPAEHFLNTNGLEDLDHSIHKLINFVEQQKSK